MLNARLIFIVLMVFCFFFNGFFYAKGSRLFIVFSALAGVFLALFAMTLLELATITLASLIFSMVCAYLAGIFATISGHLLWLCIRKE